MQEEREENREERERWIEERHRTAPGVNWRIVERENRAARINETKRGERRLSSLGAADTVANLVGRWIERGSSNQAGRVVYADLATIHYPGVDTVAEAIYAASAGGHVWRGDIDGRNWAVLNDRERFEDIRYLKARATTGVPFLLAVHNGPAAAHYSEDGGATWHLSTGLDSIARWGFFSRAVSVDPAGDTILALGSEWDYSSAWRAISTLYRSTDGGRSFKRLHSDDGDVGVHDIWAAGDGTGAAWMIHGDSLFTIHGNVVSYSSSLPSLFSTSTQVTLVGSTAGARATLYAFTRDNDSLACHRSIDTGQNWTRRGNTIDPFSRLSIAASPLDRNLLMIGGVEVWMSENGGTSWTRKSRWGEYYNNPSERLHADIPAILPADIRGRWSWLIGTDGGLYAAERTLDNVSNLSLDGLRVGQYYSSATSADGTTMAVGAQDQGFQIIEGDTGGIAPLAQRISGDYGHLSTGDGSANFWCVYPGFTMVRRPDNNLISRNFDGNPSMRLWMAPLATIPGTSHRGLAGLGGENSGAHLWDMEIVNDELQAIELPYDFSNGDNDVKISAVAVSPIDTNHWYVLTTDGTFFHSGDAGANWTVTAEYGGPGAQYFYGATVLPSRRTLGRVWVGGSGYSSPAVFASSNHGRTFDSLSTGLPPTLVQGLAADPEERYLFAATEAGPYLFRLDVNQWYDMSGANAPDQTWWGVEYVDTLKTARFVTYGRGVWDFKAEGQLAEVTRGESSEKIGIAVSPSILRASSGECRIDVSMPRAGTGTVKVYDATGRVVAEPMRDGTLSEGTTHLRWNGATAPAGRYMIVLNALGAVRYTVVVKQ